MFSMFRFLMGDKSVVCRIIRLLIGLSHKFYKEYKNISLRLFVGAFCLSLSKT